MMQNSRGTIVLLCVLTAADGAAALDDVPIPIGPARTALPDCSAPATATTTAVGWADLLVGQQWTLAGREVVSRDRVALLLEIDLEEGVVRQVQWNEAPDAPATAPATTFEVVSSDGEGTAMTLRATRPRWSGGVHALELKVSGQTVSTRETWANQHGDVTRSVIRVATHVTRLVVDHDVDGIDGLARRWDFERRLER